MFELAQLEAFVAVVEEGNFSAAAVKLSTTQPSISRVVSKLEKSLATKLINRSTRSISLTDTGHYLFGQAKQILLLSTHTHQTLCSMENSSEGVISVTSSPVFFNTVISPLLPEFYKKFPQVKLDFDIGTKTEDLYQGAYDVAIRVGEMKDSNLICRSLLKSELKLCASKQYIQTHGLPTSPEALSDHDILCMDQDKLWILSKNGIDQSIEVKPRMTSSDSNVYYYSVLSGVGLALLPGWLLTTPLFEGNLVSCLDDYHIESKLDGLCTVSILTTSREYSQKTRSFIEFISQSIS